MNFSPDSCVTSEILIHTCLLVGANTFQLYECIRVNKLIHNITWLVLDVERAVVAKLLACCDGLTLPACQMSMQLLSQPPSLPGQGENTMEKKKRSQAR